MRCTRCGNENSDQNRFCGMCGATLLAGPAPAPSQPVPVSSSAAAAPELAAARPEPVKRPQSVPPHDDRPTISGPSFLGLNDPSPSHSTPRKRARLSIDPHSAPGSNLEYLLSDEEQPRHWGPGKILLLLIALALAVGFGYLRFKTHGFAWLNPPAKKPDAAVTQNAPSDNTQPQQNSSGSAPESQPAPNQAPPSSIQPAPDGASASGNPSSSAPPSSTSPAMSAASPSPASETAKPNDNPSTAIPDNTSTADKNSSASSEPAPASPPSRKPEAPKPTRRPSIPKPSPVTKPAVAADPVVEAQKYLYGKGVPQDCDRGMRLLKPAANQSNPKAMVEMGALYSAGLCTPHDLPTAYRWFALALRKDPENIAVQTDLSKLWGEMTPPERQLAIKLSQ